MYALNLEACVLTFFKVPCHTKVVVSNGGVVENVSLQPAAWLVHHLEIARSRLGVGVGGAELFKKDSLSLYTYALCGT